MRDQLDMFASAPAPAPKRPEPKALEAIDDAIGVLCNGAYACVITMLLSMEAADLLRKLRSMPATTNAFDDSVVNVSKEELPYQLVEELRKAGCAVFRYSGRSVSVRLQPKRIMELAEDAENRVTRACA